MMSLLSLIGIVRTTCFPVNNRSFSKFRLANVDRTLSQTSLSRDCRLSLSQRDHDDSHRAPNLHEFQLAAHELEPDIDDVPSKKDSDSIPFTTSKLMPSLRCYPSSKIGDKIVNSYHIERVNTKRRALDVKVFRGFSVSSNEFLLQQLQNERNKIVIESGREEVSEDDIVSLLMPNYDEHGNYLNHHKLCESPYEPEVYFIAVSHGININNHNDTKYDNNKSQSFIRTNRVVGVVSAQLRYDVLILDRQTTTSSKGQSWLNEQNSLIRIPYPHIYLANMRVDDSMQRRGIGRALLFSIVEYAKSLNINCEKNNNNCFLPVVLSVDNDNHGAISMYEKFGFQYLEKNDFYSKMVYQSTI